MSIVQIIMAILSGSGLVANIISTVLKALNLLIDVIKKWMDKKDEEALMRIFSKA